MPPSEISTTEAPSKSNLPDHNREFLDQWNQQREGLQHAVGENLNIEARAVEPQETLQDYLRQALQNDALVLRALSSLQLHGYWDHGLPEGYQIEVQAGKLSLYKQAEDGTREYYKASQTGKVIQGLPLLAAIPHQEVLYFKSGGYRETLPLKKSKNKAEARQMVQDALEEGRFAKLTGMVNGLKISDKVRLGTRHKRAAREMLFLLEKAPSVFDAETMAWIHRAGNLDDLKVLAGGKWEDMNQPGSDVFKRVRSAEGVIQLTLAWRRLRAVLPANLVNEIRKNSLESSQVGSLQMTLAQTEATSGKELAEDRKVVVETLMLPKNPSDSGFKTEKSQPSSPAPEVQVPAQKEAEKAAVDQEPAKEVKVTGNNEESTKEAKADENPVHADQSAEEPTEAPKSPEEIAKEAWEKEMMMFQDLLKKPYPEISMTVSDGDKGVKLVELTYTSDLKQITVKQVTEVTLPTAVDAYPVYKKEDRELLNPGAVITEMVDAIKAEIQAPALEEFESLMKTHILRALPAENIPQSLDRLKENRQERQAMRAEGKGWGEVREHFKEKRQTLNQHQDEFMEGNFDSVIDEIRQHYSAKSLKLETLVGKQRYTDTTFFSGGGLGLAPLLISVEKPKDQVGLVFSGAKIKKPIFYSLESNDKYEIESPSN